MPTLLLVPVILSVLLQQANGQVGTVTQVAAGTDSTCTLFQGGNVKCWGNAWGGRLGYGNLERIGDDEAGGAGGFVNLGVTEALPRAPLRASSVAIGTGHTCALLAGEAEGKVKCWGFGGNGATGYGNIGNIGEDETPADVGFIDVGGQVTQLSAGLDHTCALLESKDVVCWGLGMDGRLGYGNQENVGDDELPSTVGPVNLGGKKVASVAAGGYHTCVLFEDGEVRCWGRGAEGQLGYGNTDSIGDNEEPTTGEVFLGGAKATQITAGEWHSCAVVEDGSLYCWGLGANGQLGYGFTNNVGTTPQALPGTIGPVNLGVHAVEVHAGALHTCVLVRDATVKCFGEGAEGQTGRGNVAATGGSAGTMPVMYPSIALSGGVTHLSSGAYHNCAVIDGSLSCWGYGGAGRLGYGSVENVGDDELPTDWVVPLATCGLGDCSNGGLCTAEICLCSPGFEGVYCEDNVDACTAGSCANGGTCIDGIEPGAFTCDCAGTGFTGKECNIMPAACAAIDCQNGAACMVDPDDAGSTACDCVGTGFTGPTCSVNIDECASNPCQNGGTCTDGVGEFTCSCATGYGGPTCEVDLEDDCAWDPCQNGGTCFDQVGYFTCGCTGTGFTGTTCALQIDDCSGNPCENGGNCIDGINSFTCECASGFEGPSCAINIDDCAGNPCPDGTCIDGINSYTCSCPDGNLRGVECVPGTFTSSTRSGGAARIPIWPFIVGAYLVVAVLLVLWYLHRRRPAAPVLKREPSMLTQMKMPANSDLPERIDSPRALDTGPSSPMSESSFLLLSVKNFRHTLSNTLHRIWGHDTESPTFLDEEDSP